MKKPARGRLGNGVGFSIALLLKPFMALFFLVLPVALAYLIWRVMPDSKLKRILFKSYGKDRGPWVRGEPKRSRSEEGPAALPRRDKTAPRDLPYDG